jgi:hypothetical protein
MENDVHIALGELPGGFGSREAGAYDVDDCLG